MGFHGFKKRGLDTLGGMGFHSFKKRGLDTRSYGIPYLQAYQVLF
jgi:hypothetical protein